MGKTPAGDVAAGALARHQPLSQNHTRRQFCFKGLLALALLCGKPIYLVMGELNIVFGPLGNLSNEFLDPVSW